MPEFTAVIHRFDGVAGWYYVDVPVSVSTEVETAFGMPRVLARIGATEWTTSLMPKGDGTVFLPVKAAVRKAEELDAGDEVAVRLSPP